MSDLVEQAAFLREAASYFEKRDTHGEDKAHWANVFNAKNCREIADAIEAKDAEIEQWKSLAQQYQRERAELADKLNGTPCAEIRWRHEIDAKDAEIERLKAELATANQALSERWNETAFKNMQNCVVAAEHKLTSLSAENERLKEERDEARALFERVKLEAQIHSGEARTHKSTVHECYQAASGATGEPGNWHGAQPVRDRIASLSAENERLRKALEKIDKLEISASDSMVNQVFRLKNTARDALVSANDGT
jgi:uncharacterized small protein (DUF1192 family)